MPDTMVASPATGIFRSLANRNYRIWAMGAIVSNIGTWMQRTAQDWLVLTQLTHKNATAMGIVMALQFGPLLLLLPWTGYAADHFDRRRLLMVTQAIMAALALCLGVLTISGAVQLWHVYIIAFLLGCTTAFDAPARQTFVTDLVGKGGLSNAVALNSTSFNAASMIGPAIAGILIAAAGTGPAFLINAASFLAVLGSLCLLRTCDFFPNLRATGGRGSLVQGFSYVWNRPDLTAIMLMLFIIGTFGLNFPIFISTMSVKIFHAGAGRYGLLTSCLACGSVAGALLAARRERPRMTLLITGAAVFGAGFTLAALAPNQIVFAATLSLIGIASQTFTTSTLSLVQLSTEPAMRGRVMAILLAVALGGTPLGAPIAGWIADRLGARYALVLGAAAGFAAALAGLRYLFIYRHFRIRTGARGLHVSLDDTAPPACNGSFMPQPGNAPT